MIKRVCIWCEPQIYEQYEQFGYLGMLDWDSDVTELPLCDVCQEQPGVVNYDVLDLVDTEE